VGIKDESIFKELLNKPEDERKEFEQHINYYLEKNKG
jgi:hypothetical protein